MTEEKTVLTGKTRTGRKLHIRYINENDVSITNEFINKISQEKTFMIFQGEKISLEEQKKYIESNLEKIKKNEAVHLLAFINGELVASSDITLKNKVFSHIGGFGIVVAQKYRGEGVGKILAKTVIREAKKNIKGLKIITLDVFSTNLVAQKLYKSIGFQEYGRLPKGVKHKNKFIESIHMYRQAK